MRNARRVIPIFIGAGLALGLAACGSDSDDDDQPESTATTAGATSTTAAGTTATATTGAGGGGDAGTARVTVGDETFEFSVTCQFGTGIIQGPGTNQDGEIAFTVMSMPKTERGEPANNPAEVGVNVTVGNDTGRGASLYEYRVTDTLGRVVSYTDDGKHAQGEADFSYEDNDGSRAGLNYGDVVSGTFEATCP